MNKKNRWLAAIAVSVLLLSMIGLLRYFSGQDGRQSNELSRSIVNSIADFLIQHEIPVNKEDVFWTTTANQLVRKAAHFLMFMVLGILISVLLNLFVKKVWITAPAALVICVILGFLDEYHQHFFIGRTSKWSDVWLDAHGAVIGIASVSIFFVALNRTARLRAEIARLKQELQELSKA